MKIIFLIFILIVLISCTISISFQSVSQYYLDTYGIPEEVNEFKSDDYHSIDWWWWEQYFMVSFVNTEYDDVNGWTVDHTYTW